jgi:transcriptional regulator with XRE-family HTH domain
VPPVPTPATIGDHIRTYRELQQLTQKDLAQAVGCTHGLISQIELGKTQVTLLKAWAIAQALGVPLVHLLNYPDCPTCGHALGGSEEPPGLQDLRRGAHQSYAQARQQFEAMQRDYTQRALRWQKRTRPLL